MAPSLLPLIVKGKEGERIENLDFLAEFTVLFSLKTVRRIKTSRKYWASINSRGLTPFHLEFWEKDAIQRARHRMRQPHEGRNVSGSFLGRKKVWRKYPLPQNPQSSLEAEKGCKSSLF